MTDDESRIDQAVGEKARQRRVALGMPQKTLADRLGITFQQVQKMEKGVNRIGAGRLWQLASILNVEIAYFYEGLNRGRTLDPQQQVGYAAANHFLGRREGQRMAVALHDMNRPVRAALLRLIATMDDQFAAETDHAKRGRA